MMMMLLDNYFNGQGNGGVMNMASHYLHINNTTQSDVHKGTSPCSVYSGGSGGSISSGTSNSSKFSKSYFWYDRNYPSKIQVFKLKILLVILTI